MTGTGKWIRLAACLFATLPAGAQTVRGPVLGFVVDGANRGLRAVSGTPAAASMGDVSELPPDLAAAVISPGGDYVLALSGAARDASLAALPAGSLHPLSGISSGAARIVVSPNGTSAAFYFPAANRVDVITGLPAAPSPVREVYLTPLRNPLKDLALSDDGELLLCSEAVSAGGPAPAVVAIGRSGDLNRFAMGGPATAIAFAPRSHDAVAVSDFEAVVLRDVAGQAGRTPLPETLKGATAAAFSADSARVYFAHARSGLIGAVALSTPAAAPVELQCNCRPQGLFRMGGSDAFRLTEYSGAALPVLDASRAEPHIVIIPPVVNRDDLQ